MFVASGDAVARTRRVGADTIQENVRDHQLKILKHNHLISNLLIFHNCRIINLVLKELETEGMRPWISTNVSLTLTKCYFLWREATHVALCRGCDARWLDWVLLPRND